MPASDSFVRSRRRGPAGSGAQNSRVGSSEAVALRRLLDVTLALAAERRTEPVLRVILDAARDLAGARYAALGVPDGAGGYSLFLTAGVDPATWAAIGALPRTHGLLGALLDCPRSIRLDDIRADPRFRGWPPAHPDMRSFLGVPIVAGGEVLAELFLADKTEPAGGAFTDSDQRLIETLSVHAALAVANAQRTERTRELSVAEERARLARELHDSVTQTLFSLTLAAESAAALADAGEKDAALAEQLGRVRELARTGLAEMRSMVGTLRPVDAGADGLAEALRKRVDLLRRVHDVRLTLRARGPARLQTGRSSARCCWWRARLWPTRCSTPARPRSRSRWTPGETRSGWWSPTTAPASTWPERCGTRAGSG